MSKYLFNPFRYIAGGKALVAGILVLLSTSIIGYYSHIHFPDLISVKTNSGIPFYILLVESSMNWLVPSMLFYILSYLYTFSIIRFIDILGTQALARTPYLIVALTGFSNTLNKFGQYTMWKSLNIGEPVQISSSEIILAILLIVVSILSTIWMITLMYNALKVAANIKGSKLTIIFIVVIVASTIITAVTTHLLFGLHIK